MQIPCKSHFSPILRNGPETDLERYYNGGITEDQRKMYERIFLSKWSNLIYYQELEN